MTSPNPPELEVVNRLASILELLAKGGVVFGLLWGFLVKIWKPYQESRRKALAATIREILEPELAQLKEIQDGIKDTREYEDSCANRLELVLTQLQNLFGDHDDLILLAKDNRDRHDETNDLLDAVGFTTDRRHPEDEERMKKIINSLDERRKRRRRWYDDQQYPPPHRQGD